VDVREASSEHSDDVRGLVDGQRRLRDVGDPRSGRELERLGLGDVLDEHGRVGCLAHRADDLLVAGVADQDDRVARRRVPARLDVHLRHERAGGVDHVVREPRRVCVHGRRHPVRGVDDRRSLRRLGLLVDEDGSAGLEVADDVDVVDDLLADVDRRPVVLQGELDGLDGTFHAGAVPARRGEKEALHHGVRVAGLRRVR
jgi:hypothetical protein